MDDNLKKYRGRTYKEAINFLSERVKEIWKAVRLLPIVLSGKCPNEADILPIGGGGYTSPCHLLSYDNG